MITCTDGDYQWYELYLDENYHVVQRNTLPLNGTGRFANLGDAYVFSQTVNIAEEREEPLITTFGSTYLSLSPITKIMVTDTEYNEKYNFSVDFLADAVGDSVDWLGLTEDGHLFVATDFGFVTTADVFAGYTVPELSDPIEVFVTRMYQVILEREPDAGSATWIDGLKSGVFTGVRVADGFILSEEMFNKDISNEDFVKILYRAFFGREADADGLATWKELLDAGCKKQYVFAGFANSTEFGTLCTNAGIVQGRAVEYLADLQTGLSEQDYKVWCFVERMYTEVLGRTADEGGVRTWVGVLKDGSYTGVRVADGFLTSGEFLAKDMTDEEYVQVLYRAFFNRDADSEGLATWTNALANGCTKQRVFAGFANSNEFGTLCTEAGITQGAAAEDTGETMGETPAISIDSFQLLDSLDRTYLCTDGTTGLLQWENACLFGTFSWSRELTEEEMSWFHSGRLYDASGAEVDVRFFADTEVTDAQAGTTRGVFGAEFPENLAVGTYTYELSIWVAEKEVKATCTFTIDTKEPTYKYMITEDEDILITGMELNGATSVVIPSQIDGKTVIGINDWAFYNPSYSSLQELTLPATLKTIGHNAFYGCTALTELTIPASVTRLDADMFESRLDPSDAVAIKAVHVEKGNAYYCDVDGVLFEKDMKTLVYLPKDYDVISYTVPAGVEAVEHYVNDHIKTLSLPASLQSISAVNGEVLEAFEVDAGNTVYSSVDGVLIKGNEIVSVPAGNRRTEYTVPTMVTSIGWSAFSDCSKLTSITIPESVTSIGSYAFSGCSALQSIVLPSTLDISSSNGYYMFSGCSFLKSVVLPQNITVIPTAMFWGCSELEEITLPDGLETIEGYVFKNCTNLEKVVIPASVNEIAADAFYGCENVVIYTIKGSYAATYASEKEIPVQYQ